MQGKLTKIVATIGPASESEDTISKLIDAGVNVFRFNTKHSTPHWHKNTIRKVQKIADLKKTPIGILLDLQGPEIRLETKDQKDIEVYAGQIVSIGLKFDDKISIIIPVPSLFKSLKKGNELLIDDGFVETIITEVKNDEIKILVKNDSLIKHKKGVNLPGILINLPSLIENDIKQLDAISKGTVDFVGLSFVRSSLDITFLRKELNKRKIEAQIIAKIENEYALHNIDSIISEADAIMVARGDLGVEVPIERLAHWQKTIISKCRQESKPVITATQILESMIHNPRPTRAEATDIAHAIFDGTDAIMLSAESASGKYPLRSVETMAKIARFNEQLRVFDTPKTLLDNATQTITNAAAKIVEESKSPQIKAVVVFTETGYTAKSLARHRLKVPVIAITRSQKTCELLSLSYGITAFKTDFPNGTYKSSREILKRLVKAGLIEMKKMAVVIHGNHWKKPGSTNALAIVNL